MMLQAKHRTKFASKGNLSSTMRQRPHPYLIMCLYLHQFQHQFQHQYQHQYQHPYQHPYQHKSQNARKDVWVYMFPTMGMATGKYTLAKLLQKHMNAL